MRRRLGREAYANPFYPGAVTYVVIDLETGRRQHFGIWADTTRAEAVRLARYHMKKVREPHPEWVAPDRLIRRPMRDDDRDGTLWG